MYKEERKKKRKNRAPVPAARIVDSAALPRAVGRGHPATWLKSALIRATLGFRGRTPIFERPITMRE